MNWLILVYFPLACLCVAWAGSVALRNRPNNHALSLALCRALLLAFPFLLVATILQRKFGPSFWTYWTSPLPAHGLILALLIGGIFVRWLCEMVAHRAFSWRVRRSDLERRAPEDFLAAVGYDQMVEALSPPWWLAWLPRPQVFLSKVADTGHLVPGTFPRICLDASLIPDPFRDGDLWWHSVLPAPGLAGGSLDPLKAVLAHDLAHFKRGDQLRTLLTLFTGALLPWEWLYGDASLERFRFTNTWLFRLWARFMNKAGKPFRRWLVEDRRLREALADEEADGLVVDGARHLHEVRKLYSQYEEKHSEAKHAHLSPFLCRLGFLALAGALLWAAPGRIPFFSIFGGELHFENLPGGWCLAVDGGSKATGVFIPAAQPEGRILVDCQKVDPNRPPTLRAVGRQAGSSIPCPCEIEMTWDVHLVGPRALSGREVYLSLTQSSLMNRPNLDLLTAHAVPDGQPKTMENGWVRYTSTIKIQGNPEMDILFMNFAIAAPGRYLFKPPVLTLLLPGGERRPYPEG